LIKIGSHLWIISFAISFVVNVVGIKAIIPFLISKKIIDMPNERSSHIIPTPKGAGIIIVLSFILMYHLFLDLNDYFFSISIIFLAIISLINDLKQLAPIIRFLSHILATSILLFLWPHIKEVYILSSLIPPWVENTLIFILILWFINLFNFMDGIDGISGTQCIILGVGSTLSVFLLEKESSLILFMAGFLTGSGLAFLFWNWNPAKVFLGDVGSIPMGLISAVLMILLCKNNLWFSAIILCNYYIIDTTATLFKRMLKKKILWKAHNEHFYQIAIKNGKSHSTVCKAIGFHGAIMIFLASISSHLYSNTIIIICLALSILSTIMLILYFLYQRKTQDLINE